MEFNHFFSKESESFRIAHLLKKSYPCLRICFLLNDRNINNINWTPSEFSDFVLNDGCYFCVTTVPPPPLEEQSYNCFINGLPLTKWNHLSYKLYVIFYIFWSRWKKLLVHRGNGTTYYEKYILCNVLIYTSSAVYNSFLSSKYIRNLIVYMFWINWIKSS